MPTKSANFAMLRLPFSNEVIFTGGVSVDDVQSDRVDIIMNQRGVETDLKLPIASGIIYRKTLFAVND